VVVPTSTPSSKVSGYSRAVVDAYETRDVEDVPMDRLA